MKIDKMIFKQSLELVPDEISFFEGSQYTLPIVQAITGNQDISPEGLKTMFGERSKGDIKNFIEPLLMAAEINEASHKDKADYFITDSRVRDYVFSGSKWKAGWVLILGDKQGDLAGRFLDEDFFVFTDRPDTEGTHFIGERETSPVYFLQLMLRYAMIWGRIKPGMSHEMSHFLEKDMPGLLVVAKDLPPLKYHIVLGLMKMGAPAVVPGSFPFPYGNRTCADRIDDIMKKALVFPNLRIKHFNRETIKLPEYANIAYVQEKISDGHKWGDSSSSFFHLRRSGRVKKGTRITGKPEPGHLGILVEIDHPELTPDMEKVVEKEALRSINYLPGVTAVQKKGIFSIKTISRTLDIKKIMDVIYWGIRLAYPVLENVMINMIFDRKTLEKIEENIRIERSKRARFVSGMTENNTERFCACIECRPFSQDHTCILTPDRIPMCASRTYLSVKAGALFGGDIVELGNTPYRRKGEKELPLKTIFDKGRILDEKKGRYEGSDNAYRRLTGGKLDRVYLHSLRGSPHTSCGCFQNLAFWIDQADGIGIMSRDSDAVAPEGSTWDALANRAGGRQCDGIMGVSFSYIKSKNFLKGDGGMGNVVWVDSALHRKIKNSMAPGQKIATEKDVRSMPELKAFIKRNRIR